MSYYVYRFVFEGLLGELAIHSIIVNVKTINLVPGMIVKMSLAHWFHAFTVTMFNCLAAPTVSVK